MDFLYRTELDYLTTWLQRDGRKPLVIRGARQVGKSTLVRLLARLSSRQLVELDFEQHPEYAELFKTQEPQTILSLLSAQFGLIITPYSSLLFLDEIQKKPEILATLRYFYEKMPELPVIATGSLLDLALRDIHFSMPVGRIEYLFLGPMGFEDFLIALNEQALVDYIRHYNLGQVVPVSIHEKLLYYVKYYFLIGGLPEAVAEYVKTESILDVIRVKKNLILSYQEDFSKYATVDEQIVMRSIFNKIPRFLGEKFKYSHIDADKKSNAIKTPLQKMSAAHILQLVYHTDANGLPLGAEVNDKFFKAYFLDVGLVTSVLDLTLIDVYSDRELTLINAGKIAEQFVAQSLLRLRAWYEPPTLYYWTREKKSSSAEIDFVLPFHGRILPIEVKAGTTGSLKSLHYFLYEKRLTAGVRICSQMPTLEETTVHTLATPLRYQLLTIPFYLVEQLQRFLEGSFIAR